jgi:hypothetical protein
MATFRTSQPGSAADPSVPHLILVGLPGRGRARSAPRSRASSDAPFSISTPRSPARGDDDRRDLRHQGGADLPQLEHGLTEELKDRAGWCWRRRRLGGAPGDRGRSSAPSRMIYLRDPAPHRDQPDGRSVAGRPLLSRPNPVAELERLLNERRPPTSPPTTCGRGTVAISEVVRRIVAACAVAPRAWPGTKVPVDLRHYLRAMIDARPTADPAEAPEWHRTGQAGRTSEPEPVSNESR